ncbi:MAG: slipin family protein [Planctomycetota bacterium]|jgi:regulator of protease activity HflC (stomatin/prohibitin superfamily)
MTNTLIAFAVFAGAFAFWRAFRESRMVRVNEHEAAVLQIPGRLHRVLLNGEHFVWSPRREVTRFDLREVPTQLVGQEVLTADSAALRISVSARYQVTKPLAVFNSTLNWTQEIHTALQLALREVVAKNRLDTLLEERTGLEAALLEHARENLTVPGIELHSARLRDLTFTGELKHALAQVQVAKAEGAARLERARAEAASLRTLANSARLLKEHEALLDLRVLSTAETAASRGGNLTLDLSAWKRGKPSNDERNAS